MGTETSPELSEPLSNTSFASKIPGKIKTFLFRHVLLRHPMARVIVRIDVS